MQISQLFNVSNEIILITGASGQLGVQYARVLLENGARVVGIDIAASIAAIKLVEQYPSQYFFYKADITVKHSLQQALKNIQIHFGTPTVLINNAAIDSTPSASNEDNGPFESYPEASWNKVIDVNLKGVFLCCQVFGSAMANSAKGSIINISSIYGLVSPDQSLYEYRRKSGEEFYKPIAYSASKSGILNLTRYLAVYWAKQKVRVNSLSLAGVFNNQDKEFLSAYCARIPVGRMADTQDYSGSILFLSSEASSYMTGSNLIVDGGWTAI